MLGFVKIFDDMKFTRLLYILLTALPAFSEALPNCAYCGKEIKGNYLVYEGKNYHSACFEKIVPKCGHCGESLAGQEYVKTENGQYHESCYFEHVALKCDICSQPITGNYTEDYWGNKYHSHHENELERCDYCGRLMAEHITRGGYVYDDGRHICGICNETAVSTIGEAENIGREIQRFLAAEGISVDVSKIPLHLVDRKRLGILSGTVSPHEMGFCHSVTTTRNDQIIARSDDIYILYGVPARTFEGILAHEMLHAWVHRNAKEELPKKVSEGMANYASYLVFSQYDDKIAEYHMSSMMESNDPVYGDGFREVKRSVERYGLRRVLESVENRGKLP